MGKFNLRTFFFLVTVIALMLISYQFLPQFPRLKRYYSDWVLTACWLMATCGAIVPVCVKQRFFSNRFWYVFVIISMIGTWTGFTVLYAWCVYEAKRSPHFPGVGAFFFLLIASMAAGFVSFVVGWLVPGKANERTGERDMA